MKYKVVDLFAGVGGLSYGFAHDTDFCILAANEILANMATAYTLNHPSVKMYNKDIKDFSLEDLRTDLGISAGDVDVVVGGPPCQAYSTVGKRLIDDPRGKLFGLVSPSQFWSILMIGLGIALIFLLPKLYKKDKIDNAIKKHS